MLKTRTIVAGFEEKRVTVDWQVTLIAVPDALPHLESGALEQVAASSLNLPGFQFGQALIAAQKVYAERTSKAVAEKLETVGAK